MRKKRIMGVSAFLVISSTIILSVLVGINANTTKVQKTQSTEANELTEEVTTSDQMAEEQTTFDELTEENTTSGELTEEFDTTDEVNGTDTTDEIEVYKDCLGEYSTYYQGISTRMQNIENAASFLNGKVINPGETLSVYDSIKPFTVENGYASGGQYFNGKIVSGIGGGVCQVSTTFYNASLLAEVEVAERHNHTITVSYVPLAQDAAISEGHMDFKITNCFKTPIYIEAVCNEGTLTFRILGKEYRPYNRTIEFESRTISVMNPPPTVETYNPSLVTGERIVTQNAINGYVAELWKHIYIDGELVESEIINTSKYEACPEYVEVGP